MNVFKVLQLVLIALLIVSIASCASSRRKENLTLGSLEERKVKVNPQDLPSANKQDARKRYKEFVKNTKDQQLRAAAMERLADIELETKQTEKIQDAERKEARIKSKPGVDTAVVDVSSVGEYANVAKQYEKLLKRYPKSKDNEKILYQLARAYDLSGQPEKSLKAMSRLMKEFPNNKHSEEVQFRRGEIYFVQKDYKRAERSYASVLSNRESPYYERSLYKHGWALFKLNRLKDARYSFYKLLDLHFKPGRNYRDFARSEKELVDDTMRVVSLSFSFEEGTKSIRQFSKQYGYRNYEGLIYQTLGELFMNQERVEDAAKTYAAYAEAYPKSREAPTFLVRVIKIYEKGGFTKRLSTAKADFVTRYAIGKPYWDRHDRLLLQEMEPHIKANLDELARHYHAVAQKSKNASDYRVSAHWYREYVRSFPADEKTPQVNFLLAETLTELKDYKGAAEEYEKTAYSYKRHKKSAEAGYAALLAHQKIMASLEGTKKTAKRHQIIESSQKFTKTFPKDKRTPSVLVKTAEELLDLKRYGEATEIAQQLLEIDKKKELKPAQKASAWAIIASSEFELGNYAKAEQASIARLRLKLKSDKNREAHVERLAASIYKQGEIAREQKQHKQAAKHFMRVAELAPGASIRATSEYDAAAVLGEGGDWNGAIDILQGFLSNFPDHKLVNNATEKLAFAYEQNNDLAKAAATYDKLYGSEKDPEKKKAMLWQMAEYYEQSKKDRDALRIYERFVGEFKEPFEQNIEAQQKIADIYQKLGNNEKRRYWIEQIVSANESGKPTERTQFLAAKGALELAEPTYQAYRSIHLILPLKTNLKKKKTAMQKSIEAYTKAANYGVAEVTTASTYKIAEIYSDLSRSLFASQRPDGLSSAEMEQYDLLLEEQAFPFEEKAIEIHETNADRVKNGVYDQWVKKSFIALRKLRPVRYAKLERSELFDVTFE